LQKIIQDALSSVNLPVEAIQIMTSTARHELEKMLQLQEYIDLIIFMNEVDAATVYVNASSQVPQRDPLGLGVDLEISTQKLHTRGPIGLQELTSYKWVLQGSS